MAEIFRDALGIPHVRGRDVLDLAAGQGEVTARDRAWQVHVDLRRAQGRLAELIGPAGIPSDVFARRARLDDTARRAFDALADEDRAFVRAYSAGVRRGMAEGFGSASEFAALDALFAGTLPSDPWPDHGPLAVLHVAHALFSSFPQVLWRAHVARTLGDAWVDALAGSGDAPHEDAGPDAGSGSNAWALHGSGTASGLPIVAGDPHRTMGLPGVYQQVRLACDEFDVIGLAFPGVPGVPHFGHTGDAAWGITNAIAHSVEVFRERLRRTPQGVDALGPEGWRAADVVRSVVHVRGAKPLVVEAIETVRGTVVTDLQPTGDVGEFVAWSVRMPARTTADLGIATLLPLLRAHTAEDVAAAYSSWIDPVNRVLAADTRGTVLSVTAGSVPDLAPHARRLPREGAASRPVPERVLPAPVRIETFAVDANERPRDPGIDVGWAYSSRHRADRITALIDELGPRDVDALPAIWGDTLSGSAAALLPHLDAATPTGAAAELRDELRRWDRRMDAQSRVAGRYAAWQRALIERVAAHPALAALHEPHGFGAVFDPWMGVAAAIGPTLPRVLQLPGIRDDVPAIVTAALQDAVDAPAWGEQHRLLPSHVLGLVPDAPDPAAALDVAVSGAGDTVRCTGGSLGATPRAWRGSVARWAWDLADRDRSVWNVPFGAAGDPASVHYADQLDGWLAVAPSRVTTDWALLTRDRDAG